MSDPSTIEIVVQFVKEWGLPQSIVAAGALAFIYAKVIKPGEKDLPTEQEMKAKWQAQQDLHDISENLKLLVTFTKETRDAVNRLTSTVWNRGAAGP